MLVCGLHLAHQPANGHGLGYMAQFPGDRSQVEVLVGCQTQQVLDVDKSDDFVQRPLAERKASVARFASELKTFGSGLVNVQEHHIAARHHDLPREHVVEAKHGAKELEFGRCQLSGLPAQLDACLDLVFGDGWRAASAGKEAGESLRDLDDRREGLLQHGQRPDDQVPDRVPVCRAIGLWQDLSDEQDRQDQPGRECRYPTRSQKVRRQHAANCGAGGVGDRVQHQDGGCRPRNVSLHREETLGQGGSLAIGLLRFQGSQAG